MRLTLSRDFYIPKNATKITHKATGAVVYVYATESGKPCARGFSGKRAKPDFALYFANEGAREDYVRRYFEGLAKWGEKYGDRGYVEPSDSPDRRTGQPFTAKVTRNGIASAKIAGRGGASAWDGKPLYWSAYA